MKQTLCYASLLLVALLFGSCQDFLNRNPDAALDITIDTEEEIQELLTAAYPRASYIPFLEPRTDNVEERVNGEHTRLNETMYYWEDYDQEDLDTPLNYWNACYSGIAQANKALELLASFPKNKRTEALYAEAFLLRAYLHFMLVSIWCEPYGRSENAAGLPYLTAPEKHAIVRYDRGTVKGVYAQIEADLQRGLSYVSDDYYAQPKFHFNKRAAYAFASRFYLMKGDWQKVIDCANYVLGYDPQPLLRNWLSLNEQFTGRRAQLWQAYAQPSQPCNLLLTSTESRLARQIGTSLYGPSINTVTQIFGSKLFAQDAQSGSTELIYPFTLPTAPYRTARYLAKFDERALTQTSSTHPRGLYVSNVLLSADEVLLNRIEAYIMQQRYAEAISDLKTYTTAKLGFRSSLYNAQYTEGKSSDYNVLTPSYPLTIRQLPMLLSVLKLRQMEFYEEGLRWFDIRRFNLEVKRTRPNNSFYKPLAKNDPRQLLQIPTEAQQNGLSPNPREGRNHLIRH